MERLPAIQVDSLTMAFGDVVAIDNLSTTFDSWVRARSPD